jgi:hypothetical protein
LPWFDKENRRGAPRHRYEGTNTWVGLDGSLVRHCQIIDLSRTGVRLVITNADSLPNKFTLILSRNSSGRPARVKWRRGNEIGAEFFATNSSSIPRLATESPKANTGSRLTADAPRAVRAPRGEDQKSEKRVSNLSLQAQHQQRQDVTNLKTDARKAIGSITPVEAHRQTTALSEQRDQVDQGKKTKKNMDLSRLQKKLGPNHIALIHALKDVDPESSHGQELASIIESLDETSN